MNEDEVERQHLLHWGPEIMEAAVAACMAAGLLGCDPVAALTNTEPQQPPAQQCPSPEAQRGASHFLQRSERALMLGNVDMFLCCLRCAMGRVDGARLSVERVACGGRMIVISARIFARGVVSPRRVFSCSGRRKIV
jgi:hypothetical protein